MTQVSLSWTILVALISGGWGVAAFIRERRMQAIALSRELLSRLMDYDSLTLAHPEIQKFLSQNAGQGEEYFRAERLLAEEFFYQAKTLVYKQLNLFDEIVSIGAKSAGACSWLRPVGLVEAADWEAYMLEKFRHPFYRAILNHEIHIFGAALREFWTKNKAAVEALPADPFVW